MKKIVAGLIFNDNLELLLQLRDDKETLRSAGFWSLPGGHVEIGESLEGAIQREVLEETNLKLSNPFYFLSLIDFFEPGPTISVNLFLSQISPPFNMIKGEGQDLRFFDIKQIKDLKTNYYLEFVVEYGLSLLKFKSFV